jgi:AcrR family transcriptional regulator
MTPSTKPGGPPGKPKQVRGDQLVAKVLDATLEELARVGYEQLSFEHVADRAEVHKVTLYRRWASKRDLARDALSAAVAREAPSIAETGAFRADLLAALTVVRDLADSPTTRAIMRLVAAGSPDDELVRIALAIKATEEERMVAICRRAVASGELPEGHDLDFIQTLLVGCVVKTYLFEHSRCTDAQLEYAVDLVVAGLRSLPRTSSRRKTSSSRPKPAASPSRAER